MNKNTGIIACLLMAATAGISGCMVGPNYKAPATTMPAAFAELPNTQPAGAIKFAADIDSDVRWWRRFNDAKLTELVEKSVVANPSITIAEARLTQARAAREPEARSRAR